MPPAKSRQAPDALPGTCLQGTTVPGTPSPSPSPSAHRHRHRMWPADKRILNHTCVPCTLKMPRSLGSRPLSGTSVPGTGPPRHLDNRLRPSCWSFNTIDDFPLHNFLQPFCSKPITGSDSRVSILVSLSVSTQSTTLDLERGRIFLPQVQ